MTNLVDKILSAANEISNKSRRGSADFILTTFILTTPSYFREEKVGKRIRKIKKIYENE
jgi:hypothetical protein